MEETESQTAGHAICITMNPEAEAEPVAFSGHMDTVHPVGLSRLGMISGKGSSDAGYITQAGIPCVDCLGVEGGDLHNIGEYALLDSLAASVKRLAAVAYCIE